MNKSNILTAFLLSLLLGAGSSSFALDEAPDTVKVGLYITSIHDIDFKQKEYVITFWLWLKYYKKEFDF